MPDQKPKENQQTAKMPLQIIPQDFGTRFKVATTLAASRLTGDLNTPEKVFLALQTGAELGIAPMAAIRGIHVISGKPTLSTDLMIGLIMARQDFHGIKQEFSSDGNSHTTIIKRKFSFGIQEFKGEFSYEDAQNAGLIKAGGNWIKYKKTMLQHRSDSIAARKAYPDLFTGCYTPEEIDPEFNERPVNAEVFQEPNDEKQTQGNVEDQETEKDLPESTVTENDDKKKLIKQMEICLKVLDQAGNKDAIGLLESGSYKNFKDPEKSIEKYRIIFADIIRDSWETVEAVKPAIENFLISANKKSIQELSFMTLVKLYNFLARIDGIPEIKINDPNEQKAEAHIDHVTKSEVLPPDTTGFQKK
jgi:hypothetical protein